MISKFQIILLTDFFDDYGFAFNLEDFGEIAEALARTFLESTCGGESRLAAEALRHELEGTKTYATSA